MASLKAIDKEREAELEGNIRELVRRDTAAIRSHESDSETSASNLGGLLRRVAGSSTREIDDLIGALQGVREKLYADGDRVQRDIIEYAELSQSVMQLTKIIAESVKKLPGAPSISP